MLQQLRRAPLPARGEREKSRHRRQGQRLLQRAEFKVSKDRKVSKAIRLLERHGAPRALVSYFRRLVETNTMLKRELRAPLSMLLQDACRQFNFTAIYNVNGRKMFFRARLLEETDQNFAYDVAPKESEPKAQAIEQGYRRGYVHGFAEALQLFKADTPLAEIEDRLNKLHQWRTHRLHFLGSFPGSDEDSPDLGVDQGRSISLRKRYKIMERDGFRCCCCGASAKDGHTLEVDHKKSVFDGGDDGDDNLWTLCFEPAFTE